MSMCLSDAIPTSIRGIRCDETTTSWRTDVGVVLAYLFLALMASWPLVTHFSTHVIGGAGVDVWDHLWTMYGTKDALMGHGGTPFTRELAYAPDGLLFYPVNLINEIISMPFQVFLGLIRSFNMLCIAQLVFAAWAAYRLALYVTKHRAGAFVAGLAFAFAPSVVSTLHNGTSAGGNAGWIAFYLWILVRSNGSFSKGYALGVGLLLAFVTHMCWYYGAFCGFATMLYFGPMLLPRVSGDRRKLLIGMILLFGVAVLAVTPLGVLMHATLTHPDGQNLGGKDIFISQARDHEFYSATVRAFFDMRARQPVDGYAHSCYFGYGVLLLAVLGVRYGWGKGETWLQRYWGILAVVFALLSLGPVLWVDGNAITLLPYHFAMKWIPFFHFFEFPYRFAVVTNLALAVLAAAGIQCCFDQRTRMQQYLLTGLFGAIIFVENLVAISWPLPISDARIPDVYAELANVAGEGWVLDFPLGVETTGHYLYYQVSHRRPVPVGINRLGSEAVETILALGEGSDPWHWIIEDLDADQLLALRNIGVRFVVCHKGSPGSDNKLASALKTRGVEVIFRDSECMVFDLTSLVIPMEM